MTAAKVIVACASVLVFAVVGLVSCGMDAPTTKAGRAVPSASEPLPIVVVATTVAQVTRVPGPTPPTVVRTVVVRPPALAAAPPARTPTPIYAARTPALHPPVPSENVLRPRTTISPATRSASYANCDAVRAAGKAPIHPGDPGWRPKFDADHDGEGCE
jgi:hypothetical protein